MNAEWLHAWLSGKSKNSQRSYRTDFDAFVKWAGKPPWDATREDLERYAAYLLENGKAEGTMRRAVNSIGSLVNSIDAEKNPPKRGLQINRIKMQELQPPDASALDAIWNSGMNLEFRLSWFLCWRLGLKSSEAVTIRWADFDFEFGVFQIRDRVVRMSSQCIRFLDQFKGRTGNVLAGRGGPLSSCQLMRRTRKLGACIGRPDMTPRELRAAHAYHAINGFPSCSPNLVAKTLGISVAQVCNIAYRKFDDIESSCLYLDQQEESFVQAFGEAVRG